MSTSSVSTSTCCRWERAICRTSPCCAGWPPINKPILLKRGPSATVKEWLLAAEYLLSGGNQQVVLCERGIKTFETEMRNTIDLAAVALARDLSHLPVIADPSHGTGKQSLIAAVSRAAVAVGADGLIIEVHPCPERALSDGPQSLDFAGFGKVMRALAEPLRQTPVCPAAAQDSVVGSEEEFSGKSRGVRTRPRNPRPSAELRRPAAFAGRTA